MFQIDENRAIQVAYKMGFDAGTDFSEERLKEAIEQIRQLKEERDEAFKMSRCECGEDECCANLVKQLRWLGDHASFEPHMHHTAADRIEKLETALRWIVEQERQTAHPTVCAIVKTARKALEGKDE